MNDLQHHTYMYDVLMYIRVQNVEHIAWGEPHIHTCMYLFEA